MTVQQIKAESQHLIPFFISKGKDRSKQEAAVLT